MSVGASSQPGGWLPQDLSFLPSPTRQATYLATGALAGLSTLPIEYGWSNLVLQQRTSPSAFLRLHIPTSLYRPALRFYTFDLTRSLLTHSSPPSPGLPAALVGGVSGASGGIVEVCAQRLFAERRAPPLREVATQAQRLFWCFGFYTYLSTTLSPQELPPRPFWKCWAMGAAAGCVGTAIVAGFMDGVRGRALGVAGVRGGMVVGTVIAVQVSSCKEVLEWVGDGK